jgi:hypothetical protein
MMREGGKEKKKRKKRALGGGRRRNEEGVGVGGTTERGRGVERFPDSKI